MTQRADMVTAADTQFIIDQYQDRESWLEGRRLGIGASDSAGILGEGYEDQSIATVWDSKINPPRAIDPKKEKRFNVAKRLEPAMRGIFTDETGLYCTTPGEFAIYRHADYPWLSATLDGWTQHPEYGHCPVELKDVGAHNRREWEEDEPPLMFNIQCQHQCLVTGSTHAFLMGLIGRMPKIKLVPRNDRFCDAMLARLEEFWGYVERKEIPPIDASAATGRILAKLYPKDTGATVVLPEDATRWAAEKIAAAAIRKEMEAIEQASDNLLKANIGEATYGEVPRMVNEAEIVALTRATILTAAEKASRELLIPGRYSWKHQSRAEHTVKASEFRVLRAAK